MKLTRRDIRMLELTQKYERHNLAEGLVEYHQLLDTLLFVNEAIKENNIKVKRWQKMSETLLFKFIMHGYTMHNILSGLQIKSGFFGEFLKGKQIIDYSSAKTVFRSQLEAFLMYQHIYVNPKNDDLKELRYEAWIYSALLQRQDFPATSDFGKKRKEEDQKNIDTMRQRIAAMPAFKTLSSNQQKSLLNNGSGKLFNHWATILKETGFSEQNPFFWMYSLLSMYSHSEGLSIIQMDDNKGALANAEAQGHLDIHHSKLLVCLMIRSIASLFDSAKERFDSLPEETRYDIEIYCMMGLPETTDWK